jgi:PAS domain S-box-containing protein
MSGDKYESRVLNQLFAAQTMLHIFPTVAKMGEYAVHAFKNIPGVRWCAISLPLLEEPIGDPYPDVARPFPSLAEGETDRGNVLSQLHSGPNEFTFDLHTGSESLGAVSISVSSSQEFEPYRSAAANFANSVAIHIENILQIAQITNYRQQLEKEKESLRETKAILQAALDQSPAGIAIADAPSGALRYVNDAGLLIRGGDRQSIVNGVGINQYVSSWQLLDLDGRPLRTEEIPLARAVMLGETNSREFIIRRDTNDDRIVLGNAAPIKNDNDQVVAGIVVFTDITERKRAEDALRQSEVQLRSILDVTPFPIAFVDVQDNAISFWSRSALTVFGHTAPTAAEWYELAYPDPDYRRDVVERWKPFLEKARSSGQSVNTGVYRVTCQDGSVLTCELYVAFLNEKLIVTFNNITERKRAEDALRDVLADLRRSNKDLQQFASIASHDLQEPLRMIGSYIQLLAKRYEGQLDEKAKEYIAYVVEGADRMQRLVKDLLTYSHAGSRGNQMEAKDSHIILGEAIENLAILIEESKAIITVGVLPIVRADASQLVQVFQNLLANAIKFRGEDIPRIHVSVKEEKHEWVFSVRDNGIGIDRQYAERIFVIFQRLHTREEYPGTGIGLAVCKRIVERHGGRIWFESEIGKGSTFFFTIRALPTVDRPSHAVTSPQSLPESTLKRAETQLTASLSGQSP